ncbi:MAG: copper amine oxidase N-terminal domain-containing protein, partial [Candidatus Aquilonibacter sp.]
MIHILLSAVLTAQASMPTSKSDPPAQEIPILFNDHHVYATPDTLKQGRVLAALVRGDTILVPLRSMFEQTGATVTYDAGSKTVHVTKPGADVQVTVGVPEVTINGEKRPLDVPPEIYQGVVVVPVRVISEGMGAYVQWVPDRQLVVVRYIPATPPPTAAPPPPATAPPPPP